ncbi:hypothetical protein CC2G_007846 [Coprinopsis cinerea AmutBmut pab1-1]|nr:hypothetical protein CC2G_007846 [Coprinopsis cinerea AmutBmut pab1-1]
MDLPVFESEINYDEIDLAIVDHEATNCAFQLQGRTDLWKAYTAQLDHQQTQCDKPECQAAGACEIMEDYISCRACFNDNEVCTLEYDYIGHYLNRDVGIPWDDLVPFLTRYEALKRQFLDTPPSVSRAGLDGHMFQGMCPSTLLPSAEITSSRCLGLCTARDILEKAIKQVSDLPLKSFGSHDASDPRPTLERLKSTLEDVRKENARVCTDSLRSRRRWMELSRRVKDARAQMKSLSLPPPYSRHNSEATLKRCESLDLLFRPELIPPPDLC